MLAASQGSNYQSHLSFNLERFAHVTRKTWEIRYVLFNLLPFNACNEVTKQNFEREREREEVKRYREKVMVKRTFIQIDPSSGSLTHADKSNDHLSSTVARYSSRIRGELEVEAEQTRWRVTVVAGVRARVCI